METNDANLKQKHPLFPMTDSFGENEANILHSVLEHFLSAYGSHEDTEDWLSAALQDEHPENNPDEIQELSAKIKESVNIWDENMSSLNEACEEGISKEEWLADRLQDAAVGYNAEDFEKEISDVRKMLHAANHEAMNEIDGKESNDAVDTPSMSELDMDGVDYQMRSEAVKLAKEVVVKDLASTVMREGWKLLDSLPEKEYPDIKKIASALQSGDDKGVKEAITAALKTSVENGHIPMLPKGTPLSVVSGIACFGVEQAKIALQYANGEISGRKALEQSSRSAIALVAHPLSKKFEAIGEGIGQKLGQAAGMFLSGFFPVIAPIAAPIGRFIGGVVGKFAGATIGKAICTGAEKLVNIAKPILKTAWEGMKSVGSAIASGIKSVWNSVFGN